MHTHTKRQLTLTHFFHSLLAFWSPGAKGPLGFRQSIIQVANKKSKREKIQAEHMTYQCQSVSSVRFFYCRFENIWDDMSLLLKWILCPCGLLNHLRHLWIDHIRTTTKTSSSAKAAWRPWTASSKTACMTHGFGSFLGWIYILYIYIIYILYIIYIIYVYNIYIIYILYNNIYILLYYIIYIIIYIIYIYICEEFVSLLRS